MRATVTARGSAPGQRFAGRRGPWRAGFGGLDRRIDRRLGRSRGRGWDSWRGLGRGRLGCCRRFSGPTGPDRPEVDLPGAQRPVAVGGRIGRRARPSRGRERSRVGLKSFGSWFSAGRELARTSPARSPSRAVSCVVRRAPLDPARDVEVRAVDVRRRPCRRPPSAAPTGSPSPSPPFIRTPRSTLLANSLRVELFSNFTPWRPVVMNRLCRILLSLEPSFGLSVSCQKRHVVPGLQAENVVADDAPAHAREVRPRAAGCGGSSCESTRK